MFIDIYPNKEQFKKLAKEGNLIPLCIDILADTDTPVTTLGKFKKDNGPTFLFESIEGGERWSRYSFLGTSARSNIKIFSKNIEICENSKVNIIHHNGNPLFILRNLMKRYKPVILPQLPGFWGGIVGYFNYETVSFFEEIPHNWPKDKPIANFIITDNLIIFDNIKHIVTLVRHIFIDNSDSLDKLYDKALKELKEMYNRMHSPLPQKEEETFNYNLTPMVEPEKFRESVLKIKNHIIEGDIIQAVLSQPFVCNKAPDPWFFYRIQRYVNPSPYLYYMHLDDCHLVGSSPETMVNLNNGVATVRPIAGTRHRGRNQQEDRLLADELLKDNKEKAEHLMLVDLGRNDLGKVAETGSVQVTNLMFVERYSHVMHLVSNVCCDLKTNCDAWDLFKATFPAGTLSGAPKIRAMKIISELEDSPRGPYGGAIGYVSFTGNMDFAITIRTAQIDKNRLIVQAGAGIVADSDPEKERQETENKAKAMQKALQLINKPKINFL